MKRFLVAMILAGLVAVPVTFARDDAPAESKTAKGKKTPKKDKQQKNAPKKA